MDLKRISIVSLEDKKLEKETKKKKKNNKKKPTHTKIYIGMLFLFQKNQSIPNENGKKRDAPDSKWH